MKTFEMMKLAEQTGERYKALHLHYSHEHGFTDYDTKQLWPTNTFKSINEILDVEGWEEVKEPVTWQEAIQAWLDGKTIVHVPKGEKIGFGASKDDSNIIVSREDFENAEWFIDWEESK